MSERNENGNEYVTASIGDELIGLPILRVQDVFAPERITPVPLAPAEIAGVLNLRGRIVTLIDLRVTLGMPPRPPGQAVMAIGVESRGESYGLVIDSIGEVLQPPAGSREPIPLNLDPRLARIVSGIHRLQDRLLLAVDIDRVLETGEAAIAA